MSIPDALNRISGQVVDAAIEVHRALGPGLLESVYERCLRHELQLRGLQTQSQIPVPIRFKDLGNGFTTEERRTQRYTEKREAGLA